MTDASTFGLSPPPSSAETFGLTQPSARSKVAGAVPDPFIDVAPAAINFLDYPARAVEADLYGVAKPLFHGQAPTREQYEQDRAEALKATTIPESPTGEAISSALNIPGEVVGGLAHGASNLLLGPEATKQLAPFAGAATDVASLFGARIAPKLRPEVAGADKATVAAAKLDNQARQQISDRFASGLYEAGPSAVNIMNDMTAAKQHGQPLTLSDVKNPELQSLLGTVHRQGGEARSIIEDFMKGRNVEQGQRVRTLLRRYTSNDSARETAKELFDARSEHARPLFAKVEEGGSTAPLTHQFSMEFTEASRREAVALKTVREQLQQATSAQAKKTVAGNVYSSSAALRAERVNKASLIAATDLLKEAREEKAAIHNKLMKAQADGTANAPGAVWSPHLQRMLDLPEMKQGLAHGYAMERRKAVATGRKFNPREYAVIGEEANGDPLVGQVPNMRLLMAAKEGLDAMIADNIDPLTGRPTKNGQSLLVLRDGEIQPDGSNLGGFLPELDRLSPLYKQARDQWSGDSNSFLAIDKGKHLLDTKWFPEIEDVSSYLQGLTTSDREFVKVGLAADLLDKVYKGVDSADKSKRVVNSDLARERLPLLLGPETGSFLAAIERDRVMKETPHEVYGGAPTAKRLADDSRLHHSLASAIESALHLHPVSTVKHLMSAVRHSKEKPNEKLNAAVARIATDPNIKVQTKVGEPLLGPVDIPIRGRRGMSPIEGAIAGATVGQATAP